MHAARHHGIARVFADSSPPEGPLFCFFSIRGYQYSGHHKARAGQSQIRISPVRVIGADGSQLGILEVDAALRMAEEAGLDLVEVAATARPPVVRIMDYGKYKFEMAKQARRREEEAARDRAQGSEVPSWHR